MLSTIRIALSETVRCGPHFCSMKITEGVRKYAAEQKISENEALEVGLREKAKEFVRKVSQVCART